MANRHVAAAGLKTAFGFQQGRPIFREEAHNIQRNDERTARDIMNGAEKTPRPTIAGESTMKFLAATTTKPNKNWRLWFEDGMCCGGSGCGCGCDVVVDVSVDVGVVWMWFEMWVWRGSGGGCGARCGAGCGC